MTEKQTQPSAIAQAAAREIHERDDFDCCRDQEYGECGSHINRLAALIDKHLAPLREDLDTLKERDAAVREHQGQLVFQRLQGKLWLLNIAEHEANKKLEAQAAELERLRKQLGDATQTGKEVAGDKHGN